MPERRYAKLLEVLPVRLGRTVSSISFSRNAASYFPRPRLRSQTTMSMTAPTIGGGAHHLLGKRGCPGWRWCSQGSQSTVKFNVNGRSLTLF